jgi:hypothetical protein
MADDPWDNLSNLFGASAASGEPSPHVADNMQGQKTTLRFSDQAHVPMWIRSAREYEQMAKPLGFTLRLHDEPPFTEDFRRRFGGENFHPGYSEYLILGFDRR